MAMKNSTKGTLALIVSRIMAGANVNCTKYLLPLWITPIGFVAVRLFFGAASFWLLAIFSKPDTSTVRDRVKLFLLGAVAIFGYMSLYAVGMSYTTPINFAMLSATQPIWVFVFSVFLRNERVTKGKVAGIVLGFSGVVVASMASPVHTLASNRMLGNCLALASAVCYSLYLINSSALLRRVSNLVMLRYTFSGAAFTALVTLFFTGMSAPMLSAPFNSKAIMVFIYVLLFPTAVNYLLVPIGLKYLKTTLVAIYGYITLIVATIVSLLLGQDSLDFMLLLGMMLICVSIYFVSVAEKSSN